MRARPLAALAALAALVGAGSASAGPRIVGGQPASTTDLPFMAGLEIAVQGTGDSGPDALCAGSLIAARWVLTAAHCLAEQPVDVGNSIAVIGATNLNASTPAQEYRWAEAIPDPRYADGGGGHDVGLIRLARPATAQQLRLPRPFEAALYAPGVAALTAGWGFTEDQQDGGALSTSQLRSVELSVVSDPDCASSFSDAGQGGLLQFDTELCAIAPGRDSCNGDSGGPLIVGDRGGLPVLVGAVSFGIGSGELLRGDRSCNEGPPGVYAEVAADPLNSFVRSRVPQVEIDTDVGAPVVGQDVTFTAVANAPGANGPFGGYDALSWDLDGDNNFDESRGQRSVTLPVRGAVTDVAVLATTTAGDAEVRRLRIAPVVKSAVSFARSTLRSRRGNAVTVKVKRVGRGAGAATLTASGAGATPSSRVLRFTGDESSRSVTVRGRRAGTATLRLRSFTGDVVAGAVTKLKLRVRRR